MNNTLPRLDNLAFTKCILEKRPQTLYSLQTFPSRKSQPMLQMPTKLVGTQLAHRGVSCQSSLPRNKGNLHQYFPKRNSYSAIDTVVFPLADLFGYYSPVEPDVEQGKHQLECNVLSQSTGTVTACSPIQEKIMLSTFSRPPSSLKASHTSVTSVKSVIIPSIADAMVGPSSNLKARPNSARQIITPTSPSRSPSPSCLNRDFIHNKRVLSYTGQRSARTARDSAKDTISGGASVIYSLGIPRESPCSVATPIYELSTQFFCQNNSPLQKSLPSNQSFSISPSSIEAEISLAGNTTNVSVSSIEQSSSSELIQCTSSHVVMDQPVYCSRPSAQHAHIHLTEPKAALYSQYSLRKCISVCSSPPTAATNLVKGVEKSQKLVQDRPQENRIGHFHPQIKEKLSISSTLLHSQINMSPLYNFRISVCPKRRSVSASENSQLRRLVPCTSNTEYINGLIDRRGFHPYASRYTTIHS